MKYTFRKQIWLLLLASVTLASCNDFIDRLPENSVETSSVDYTNLADMYKPVSGVYAVANNKLSFWGELGLMVVRGDDANKGSNPNDQIEFQYCKDFQYDKIKSYWALNSSWEGLYNIVSTANAALSSLNKYGENVKTDADRKNLAQYSAEIRFLRGYAFYRITQLWGAAPLLIDNQQLNLTKSSKDDVHKFIQSEMDYCVSNLPDQRPNQNVNPGAVTKYSALMLKAKLALLDGDYNLVLSTTNDIINSNKFNLYSDFYQLFKIPGKLSNESLFELQFTDFGTASGQSVTSDAWFAFQGPRSGTGFIQGWGFMTPSQSIRTFLTSRNDSVRAKTTFMYTNAYTPSGDWINPGQPGEPDCYNGKAYTPSNQMTPGRTDYGMNNNIRVFRYADVLLMNAEAKVRLGQNGDSPLNLVRQRAKLSSLTNASVDQILDERRAEFAMEWGDRFFDLLRTGKLPAGAEYYPIPQNQIDLNPNLK